MLLSIDSSAVTASVALTDGDKIIKNEFMNTGLTHSETLLPMVKRVMQGVDYKELDAIAITAGPGSFTGVRIGVATVKGLAFVNDTPCVSVSTLEAIAYNFVDKNCVVCAVMDARRMQFYNALFEVKDGKVERLTPDRAISIDDLRQEIKNFDNVIIAGDGARLCFDNINLSNCEIADDDCVYQNAIGVAKAAQTNNKISPKQLMPVYLRQSQAERELKLKLKK
jgi:tRNA threonylcarbamoyladenosine biosynthesis protein TsaB